MVITSSHNNWKSEKYKQISISGNRGKDAGYEGICYPLLAPKIGFWKEWHNNIGKVEEMENNKFYIRKFYDQVLFGLDPDEVLRDIDNSVLLCYEPNDEFCHRHIVSAWLELTTGVETIEAKCDEFDKLEVLDRPEYIKEYLSEVMGLDKTDTHVLEK